MPQHFTTSPRLDVKSVAINGASVHSQPQVIVSVQLAERVVSNSVKVKHACNSDATKTPNALMLMLTASTELLVMTTSCTQSKPWTRKQLKLLAANVRVSSELRKTHRFSCPLPWTRIKPPRRHLLMMRGTCLDVKRLFAWTMKSCTSSGLTTSRWTVSNIYVALRTFNLRHGSSLRHSKRNIAFFVPSCTRTAPLWQLNQHGKRWCLAVGSSWEDLLKMLRRATALTTWRPGLISSGLKTSQQFWVMIRSECDDEPVQKCYTPNSHRTETVTHSQGSHPCSST